jgi:hypothetical protein
VRTAVLSAPRESQPGPCGLRFELLKVLIPLQERALLKSTTKLLNKLLSSPTVPQWIYEAISSARLVALSKPGAPEGKVRPVAMGCTWSKLIGRGLKRCHQDQIDALFAPTSSVWGSQTAVRRFYTLRAPRW